MIATDQQLSGAAKAAVLLVQMGKEQSSRVLRSLGDSEVELVMAEIARLESIDPATVSSVLREFHEIATARNYYLQAELLPDPIPSDFRSSGIAMFQLNL